MWRCLEMPVLCMFYGIIVRMYRELGGKHNIPHIHVEYSGQEAVIGLGWHGAGRKASEEPDETRGWRGWRSTRMIWRRIGRCCPTVSSFSASTR